MEYFLLKMDKRAGHPAWMDGLVLEPGGSPVVYTEFNRYTELADYFCVKRLFSYSYCISNALKGLWWAYAGGMSAEPFFLTSRREGEQRVYWKVTPPGEGAFGFVGARRAEDLLIRRAELKQEHLFKVAFDRLEYLVVSLALAEDMLRRGILGVAFQEVRVE